VRIDRGDLVGRCRVGAAVTAMNALALVLRWLHIVPAVVAGGATAFAWIALLPAFATLSDTERLRLKETIDRRWRVVVMVCITLLLVSGIANFFLYQAPAHRGQTLYHALFGVKFVAAMIVFFLASALYGRSAAFAPIRANARFYAGVATALVLVILLISGVLRSLPHAS
jgi:uncharacterized membrane protein